MRAAALLIAALVVALVAASAIGPVSAEPDGFRTALAARCYECHGGGNDEGGLRIDRLGSDDRDEWALAIRRVARGEMPPEDEPRLTPGDRRTLLDGFRRALASAPSPRREPVSLRRLNRTEYDRTIRDLLGIDFSLAADFPADDTGYGFDNNADVLTMSPVLMERYLAAAEDALDRAIVIGDPYAPRTVDRAAGEGEVTRGGRPVDRGVYFFSNGAVLLPHEFPVDAEYAFRVRAWADQAGPDPARMALVVDGEVAARFDVDAVRGKPGVYEARVRVFAGRRRIGAAFTNDYYRPDDPDPAQRDRNLYVDGIEVTGPLGLEDTPKPASHRRIFLFGPGEEFGEANAAFWNLEHFARRAWRRPVPKAETIRLYGLYEQHRKSGEGYEESVKAALTAALVSPRFLYRVESGDLDDHERAVRLSYFLWSSMPDERLFRLAEKRRLDDDAVLAAEVDRMLADPKADALTESFAGQWLGLRDLAKLTPDPARFPEFDEDLRAAIARETELTFQTIVHEDRSVLELIDADWTWLNGPLARLYGIEGVEGEEFRRVLVEDPRRGGVLTQASVLALTSNPTRTSPVKRGQWVLDRILGAPPPPPPAGVPSLEKSGGPGLSVRERLAAHREDPSCAACHATMDPIGLAFENYDPIGRWRETEDGHAIDATGVLPDGTRFDGPAGLKRHLLANREAFVRAFAERLLTYALGRGPVPSDEAVLDDVVAAARADGWRFSAIVRAIVLSAPFRTRRDSGGRR